MPKEPKPDFYVRLESFNARLDPVLCYMATAHPSRRGLLRMLWTTFKRPPQDQM